MYVYVSDVKIKLESYSGTHFSKGVKFISESGVGLNILNDMVKIMFLCGK